MGSQYGEEDIRHLHLLRHQWTLVKKILYNYNPTDDELKDYEIIRREVTAVQDSFFYVENQHRLYELNRKTKQATILGVRVGEYESDPNVLVEWVEDDYSESGGHTRPKGVRWRGKNRHGGFISADSRPSLWFKFIFTSLIGYGKWWK